MRGYEFGGVFVTDHRPQQLSRTELYELVWSLPMKILAARYGISDVALAKLCRRRQVPVGRSTIRRILKATGLPPVPQRPASWQAFLQAHWGVIAAADFFTTEVWTWRGLVTYYTVFVIDLASRRVHALGSTPHPSELFMCQVARMVTAADDGVLVGHRVLICDRDQKWSRAVRRRFGDSGIRVVLTPERATNANAYAERFVRSIKEEYLDRIIPIGERHFRRVITEFVAHYHHERNHQGLDNRLIAGTPTTHSTGRVHRHQRLGGLLNYYERAA
jgi:transposase InsO family protein